MGEWRSRAEQRARAEGFVSINCSTYLKRITRRLSHTHTDYYEQGQVGADLEIHTPHYLCSKCLKLGYGLENTCIEVLARFEHLPVPSSLGPIIADLVFQVSATVLMTSSYKFDQECALP